MIILFSFVVVVFHTSSTYTRWFRCQDLDTRFFDDLIDKMAFQSGQLNMKSLRTVFN